MKELFYIAISVLSQLHCHTAPIADTRNLRPEITASVNRNSKLRSGMRGLYTNTGGSKFTYSSLPPCNIQRGSTSRNYF